jgi:SAM-dependent methyltransferase
MIASMAEDPKQVVRRGYDALSARYDEWSGGPTKYRAWLSELHERIPAGAAVLDLGCGSGLPVARDLVAAGHRVTGVDLSDVQIRRARELVPQAEFVPMWWSHADAATYRSWITQAGLSIEREELVPEGDSGHALFWASRPLPSALQPPKPPAAAPGAAVSMSHEQHPDADRVPEPRGAPAGR